MILLIIIALFLIFYGVKSSKKTDGTGNSEKQSNIYFLGALFAIVLVIIEFFVQNKNSNDEKIRQNNNYKDSYRNNYRNDYKDSYTNNYNNININKNRDPSYVSNAERFGNCDGSPYENNYDDSDGDSSGD